MNKIVFGRPLADGTPDDSGPKIELDPDSPTLAKLREATGPVRSNPVTGEWGAGLVFPEETDGEYSISLGIVPAGADGPDEHVHPNCAERFVVVEGEVVFTVDGEDRTLTAGNGATVSPDTPHTFRNDSDSLASFTVEIRPSDETTDVIATLFGLAHDGKVRDNGQPKFLRGMVLADATAEDTYFTSPPRPLMRILTTVFAPVGRSLGYRAIEPRYAEESFWREHVEQPDWEEIDAMGSAADDD